jgi:hypothetical protein
MLRTAMRLLISATVIAIPAFAFGQDVAVQQWVRARVSEERLDFDNIVEIKRWLQAPQPNTYVILAIGSKDVLPGEGFATPRGHFALVFLLQSGSEDRLADPKELSFLNFGPVFPENKAIRNVSIDVTPYHIREKEYAFGMRKMEANLGNKGGLAFEILTLYRLQGSELKEVFRDFTWAYSKYSEPGLRSCNVEAVIVAAPERQGEFFNLVRKQIRSYLGDTRNPQFEAVRSQLTETPVDSCSLIGDMQFPNTHRWDHSKGAYLESGRSFLNNPDLWGKGIFIGRDR